MKLTLTIKSELLFCFFPVLREGVILKGNLGCSIEAFISEQLGLTADYIQNRIQTVFLNGKAVDDVSATLVPRGSTLTLSAAMPGLAGATLRRGSYYASMRQGISCGDLNENAGPSEGEITLKLFNLITEDLGPKVLQKGFWIKGKNLSDHLISQPNRFWKGCLSAELDHENIDPIKLAKQHFTENQIFFRIVET